MKGKCNQKKLFLLVPPKFSFRTGQIWWENNIKQVLFKILVKYTLLFRDFAIFICQF